MTQHRRTRALRSRLLAGLTLGVAAVVAVSACSSGGSSPDPGADAGPPRDGGTLKVAFWPDNAAFTCVEPFQTYWIEHRTVVRNVADSLTDQDPETGEIRPWLATKWEINPAGTEYTFHLRPGVTFSDGTPLDAAAVKANADGWLKTVEQTHGSAYGASYVVGLRGARVVDPQTVTFEFDKPNSSFLQATSTTNLAIISPGSYTRTPAQRCLGDYTASGPFTLVSYKPNELTKLARRADYAWGSALSKNTKAPHLDGAEFTYVAEDSVRTGNLISKAVDIAWPRNPLSVEDRELITKSGDSVQSRSLPGVSSTFFPNVTAGKPLSDLNVRKALYKAIDLKTYAATVYGKDYPVVEGAFDTTTPYFVSQSAKLGYDAAGAGALLDQAGYRLGADGYRAKDGRRLTLVYPVYTGDTGIELVQDQLKKVGIELKIDKITQAEYQGRLASGSYDLTSTYFTRADPGALQFILDPDLANSRALAVNASTPQTREKIKALFAQATQTTDKAVTEKAYAELQSLLIDEGVDFPLFERLQYAGVSSGVHGFAFTSESFLKLNDVWKQQ